MERKLFYRPRPIRIWYLIDSTVSLEDIKKIMQLSFKYFWWRYNQFFQLESDNFTEEQYMALQQFDADIYVSLFDISDELKDILITRFSPLEIINKDKFEIWEEFLEFHWWYINKPPRFIYWDQFNFNKNNRYINFVCDNWCEQTIKEFLSLNFWCNDKNYHNYFWLLTNNIHIGNKGNLIEYFNEVDCDSEFVFKNTLSQLSFYWEMNDDKWSIEIIIWNTVQDYLYFWNNNNIYSEFEAINIKSYIIPVDNLEENKDLINALIGFIKKYILTYYSYKIIIKSFTFSEQELKNNGFWDYLLNLEALPKVDIIEKVLNRKDWLNIRQWPYLSLHDSRNVVNLNTPCFWNFKNWELFMTDVFIEYSTWENIANNFWIERWFISCSKNNNAYREFFMKPGFFEVLEPLDSRINNMWWFSLLFRDNVNYHEVTVNILSENKILHNVLLCKSNDEPVKMENFKIIYDYNFDKIKPSNEWKKANAIFKLFWFDWNELKTVLDNSDLRELFIEYNQIIRKEESIEIIKDIIESDNYKSSIKKSEKIFNKINEQISFRERYITLNQIFRRLWINDDLIIKYNNCKLCRDFTLLSDEESSILSNILNQIEILTNIWVLRQWIEFKCSNCWERYWMHVWDIQEKNICRWCWTLIQLGIESEWTYAFNSMLKWSNIKWAFPVLHYLLKLREQYYWSSFLYGLWLECIKDGKAITDCDIISIINWRLFLSEVKNNRSLLTKHDFDNMRIISKKIKPNVIIFAAYWKISEWELKNFENWSNELKDSLCKYWTKIHYVSIDDDRIMYFPY